MKIRSQKGFTLIEVVVVAGIIAILAGVLVPMIFGQIDESKKARALADCKSLQTAIMRFKNDTGAWPFRSDPVTSDVSMLITADPAAFAGADVDTLKGLSWNNSRIQDIRTHLRDETFGKATYGANWKGPYLTDADLDPWGRPYVISTYQLQIDPATGNMNSGSAWILSAGPAGVYETAVTNDVLQGDDIGLRLK